ncbi:MAG: extracellular solute-binding protein [Oscillospiraceae bacterium]|nr:extracellular solute-binding protein [Oscillospiraceae bacterium]
MTKENIYTAIGEIDDRYIKDVLKEEADAAFHEYLSDNSLNSERTIVMDVVRRKKISKVFVIAAVLLLSLAAVAVVAGIFGKDKKDDRITDKIVENYFTDNGKYNIELAHNIENLASGSERVFFTSYVSESDYANKLAVYDRKTNRTKEIDISTIDLQLFQKIYLTEECSFIFYSDTGQNNCICRFDRDFSSENTVVVKTEGYVYSIYETERDTLLITENINNGNDYEIKVLEYTKNSLELVNTLSFDALITDRDYSTIKDILCDDDFFYVVCGKKNGQTDIVKCNVSGEVIYTSENICGDMEGEYSGCLMSEDKDIIVFSSHLDSQGIVCHSFDQISTETGKVIFRYDEKFETGNFVPCYLNYVYSNDSKYDFEYLDTDSCSVYGYSFENEEKTEIWKLKNSEFCSLQVASMDSDIILYGYSDSTESVNGTALFVTDMSGNIIRKILLNKDKGNEHHLINISMYVTDDNELYYIKNDDQKIPGTVDVKSENFMYHYSKDGELINYFRLELPESDDRKILAGNFRHYSDFSVREDGSVICLGTEIVDFFSSDGSFENEIEYSGATGLLVSVNGEECLISESSEYRNECGKIYRITNYNKLESVADFNYKFADDTEAQIFDGDSEYDFYISESDGIYGYKISEGEMYEIINWIDSDFDSAPQTVSVIDKNRIICGINDYFLSFEPDNYECKISALMFERVSNDILKDIQSRKTVTIACDNVSIPMMKKIAEFNRTHHDCRITVREYSRFYESDIPGFSKFNRDLISGVIPDIVINNGTIDMKRYSQLGMFTDLNNLIDGDAGIDRSDYYNSVFNSFSEDGKIYELPLFFGLKEIIGKETDTQNIEELSYDALIRLSEEKRLFTNSADELVTELINNNIAEFVDFKNYSCDFNNDDFKDILKLIDRESVDGTVHDGRVSKDFQDNKCTFELCGLNRYVISEIADMINEPVVYINYPSIKSSGTLVDSHFSVAVTEKSGKKEYAWEFIKILLSDEFQNSYDHGDYRNFEIPVKRTAAEICIKNDSERINKLIDNASRSVVKDSRINMIIDEQTDLYFSGSQSTEETADNIQKKVSLYLKEIR